MGNFANEQWTNVNASAINNILNSSAVVNSKIGTVEADQSKRTTVEITQQFPFEDRIIFQGMMLTTGEMSHVLYQVASQIFDDADSAYVKYDPNLNKVVGELYFRYNAKPKSDTGLLAFKSTLNSETPSNIVNQMIMRMQQQNSGECIITKEAMDIMSDWVVLPNNIDRRRSDWPSKIRWKEEYVHFVKAANEYGVNLRVQHIDMEKIFRLLIKEQKVYTGKLDNDGKPEFTVRSLDIAIRPNTLIPTTGENLFEVCMVDIERAQKIIELVAGAKQFNGGGNSYVSYR